LRPPDFRVRESNYDAMKGPSGESVSLVPNQRKEVWDEATRHRPHISLVPLASLPVFQKTENSDDSVSILDK
jgi:hypothetical protein